MAPIPVSELVAWLDALLAPGRFDDYAPNGLQVDADRPVTRVATGVTANLDFLEAAAAWGAELAVVHHGLYWHGAPATAVGPLGRRLRLALTRSVSIAAYHLPLDAHLEVGNAAGLAALLGLDGVVSAFPARGGPTGCIGRFPILKTIAEVRTGLDALFPQHLFFEGGPATIATVGVVTGGAPRVASEARALGCDLFITGEASEQTMATAREEGIHVACCGHHRTERFGPIRLAERLAASFPSLAVRFIDVENPA